MTGELLVVGVAVAGAAAYLARAAWRVWSPRAGGGCGSGCGGCGTRKPERVTIVPVEQLQVRRRQPEP